MDEVFSALEFGPTILLIFVGNPFRVSTSVVTFEATWRRPWCPAIRPIRISSSFFGDKNVIVLPEGDWSCCASGWRCARLVSSRLWSRSLWSGWWHNFNFYCAPGRHFYLRLSAINFLIIDSTDDIFDDITDDAFDDVSAHFAVWAGCLFTFITLTWDGVKSLYPLITIILLFPLSSRKWKD